MGTRTTHGHDGEFPPALEERTCGRCRERFAGDPALAFQTGWALCPACTDTLLPGRSVQ